MAELFSSHSVLLAPGKEDFGYGPLEANYSGRPAIAIAIAGALETVQPGRTGQLVDTWDPLSWAETLRSVLSTDWSPEVLRASTRPFSGEAFDAALSLHIENL
jgi:glycosyltransferase involved in cell wall biosynthesis